MSNSWPRPSRTLVVIQDGIGDRSVPELGQRTPLEAARTPMLDAWIRAGAAGLMEVAGGEAVATHTGHLALFGQEQDGMDHARGPMEASGVGLKLLPNDVALRFNLATVDSQMRIVDRRAGRIREDAERLVSSLNQIELDAPVELIFAPATEHRGVLVLRGENLSPYITDSDPGSLNTGQRVLSVSPKMGGSAALHTAECVNEVIARSHRVLQNHRVNQRRRELRLPAANIILTRGAGTSQRYVQLPEKLGIAVACVSGEATVLGLARLCGIHTRTSKVMTANLDTDLQAKAAAVMHCLEDHELVYLHLKGCDIAGHDRSPQRKLEFIERTDEMLGRLLPEIEGRFELHLVALGDHCTWSHTGDHCEDPVPVFMAGPGVAADSVVSYGERTCRNGAFGRLPASALMAKVFERFQRAPEVTGVVREEGLSQLKG